MSMDILCEEVDWRRMVKMEEQMNALHDAGAKQRTWYST